MVAIARAWRGGAQFSTFESRRAYMGVVIFIVITAASGAWVTSLRCRRAQARRCRAGWHLTIRGTLITALLTGLFIGQPDLFYPDRWDNGKVSIWFPVMASSSAAAVFAFVASVIVVAAFRARFRDENHVA